MVAFERALYQRAKAHKPENLLVIAPYVHGCEAFDEKQPYRIKRTWFPCSGVPVLGRGLQGIFC